MNDFDKKLDFDSNTFENMKHDMNFVLQRLLGNMIEKQSNEGSMTIKIDVTMVKEFIPNYDPNIKGESREISKPQFKHKVTSAVKITDEKGGNLNNEMEMVMDEETGCYVLQPIANTQQRTIFDSDFMQGQKQEGEGNEDIIDGTYIDADVRPALPGPADEEKPAETENWYFTGEQRTGCCVCGSGCHLEPVPNRLQRLRTSDNDKHRRMCEGCLQIKNHGMTYEQALNYAGIPTEEVQEDE